MRRCIRLLLLLLCLCGCHHTEEPLPPVPPAPEDLSTWSVPELVQPPTPETPLHAPPAQEKATPAEQILDFAPGTTFSLTVSVGAPLDLVLQHRQGHERQPPTLRGRSVDMHTHSIRRQYVTE